MRRKQEVRESVLEINSLHKSFGNNHVLRGVDLSIKAGEVTILMGVNGAGKSTLVNVISGYHSADDGSLRLSGKDFNPKDAADAIANGIVTVHQSINDGIIPDLDIANNLMLSRLVESRREIFVREGKLRKEAKKIASTMGINSDLRTLVGELPIAERQMIAIARALAHEPKLMIFDEPTSSLSAIEAQRLFGLIRSLKDRGVAILYISHRLSDIKSIADRIITMKDGMISGDFVEKPLNIEGAIVAMLGHKFTETDIIVKKGGHPVIKFEEVRLRREGSPVNFVANEGEVVAVTGLLGSGKSLIVETIFGMKKIISGQMTLDGNPYEPSSIRDAVKNGVFMVPRDRSSNATVPDFEIYNNMTVPFLKSFSRISFLDTRKQIEQSENKIDQLGIVCQSSSDNIKELSGGNQQKVMISRWLIKPCRVLLLDEPFQGVDIGARHDIGNHVRMSAKDRATIVFVSELDEAIEIADRIITLNEGNIVGEHLNSNIDLNVLVSEVSEPMKNKT